MRSIAVAALLISVCAVGLRSQSGPLRDPGNQSPDHQQIRGNDALDAIASQLSAMREQTARIEKERTEREANPFWPPVPSNWFLILLTGGAVVAAFMTLAKLERQTKAATGAAKAAKLAAVVASREFQVANRPQLVVRHVVVDGIASDGTVGPMLTNGYLWVTNVGVFKLALVKFHHEWLFAPSLPIENPALNALDTTTNPVVMKPASFTKLKIQARALTADEIHVINNKIHGMGRAFGDPPDGTLFLIGYVKYQDRLGLRRRYFAFEYDTALRYFTAVDHPGYSYED